MKFLGLVASLALLLGSTAHAQSNIAPASKHGWQENTGWMNWRDANGTAQGVVVGTQFLRGYAWGENIGWIHFGDGTPTNGSSYANVNSTDYGVNVGAGGLLTGYAWGENVGWIRFGPFASLPTVQQARVDLPAARLRGFVWGENIGWLNLDDSAKFVGLNCPDSDGDGFNDCVDGCPNDPNKSAPGVCGCGVPDTDSDGDGTPNCIDGCPNDPNKIAPGICGCGVSDIDSDGDGTPNCLDGCPNDPNKIAPGVCGCGVPDTDSDGDGTPNCIDGCPNDPFKIAPGICGCGVPDTDSDGDGTPNCIDGCPNDPNKIAPGVCGCGTPDTDSDGDGTPNCVDGCPNDPNKVAPGQCGCGAPDTDTDGDGVADCNDNCPQLPNPSQADCDSNLVGDVCQFAAGTMWDTNLNGTPDQCEACPAIFSYCTAGTSTNGCTPTISAPPNTSLSTSAFMDVIATGVEGQKLGVIFYGIRGPINVPWAPGSTSRLCVRSPVQRIGPTLSGGTAGSCNGTYSVDLIGYFLTYTGALGQPVMPGTILNFQAWFRDPPAPGTTNLSNAVQFTLCP